jgi:site-specific recombinase XerD
MATIHKRRLVSGEEVWELTHGTGSDRQRFPVGKTREEAQNVLKHFEHQLALHGNAPSNESVVSVIGQYGQFLRTNRRPATVVRYLRVLKTFEECYLKGRFPDITQLRQLRPMHIEEYKRIRSEGLTVPDVRTSEDAVREQHLRLQVATRAARNAGAKARAQFGWLGRHGVRTRISQRTINYELRVLFTFCHWAIKRNHLFLNPCGPVERFRLPKRVIPKFLTSEELRKFFAACDDTDRRLFMAILLSGMRKGEVEHLCWSDVSLELGVIFIQEKADLLVFANEAGNRDTHILERLKATCRRAGIRPSTVHALRHSFGAHLRMAGASLADIGDLLGHKDLATTQIYAKVQQEHLRAVIGKLTPLAGALASGGSRVIDSTGNKKEGTRQSSLAVSQEADKPPQ